MQISIKKKNISLKIIATYIIALLLLFDGGSMYLCIVGSPISGGILKVLLIFLCLIYVALRKHFIQNSLLASFVLVAYMAVYMFATRYNTELCLLYTAVFVVLLLYSSDLLFNKEIGLLFDAFSTTVVVFAIISLFFWLFGSLLHFIPKKAVLYIWGREYAYLGYNYFYVYFENPIQAAGSIIRNTGVYTEAPGYVDRLVFALCIELFYRKGKNNKFRIGILILTLLTTLSSKAFILLIYLIGVKWAFYASVKSKWRAIVHFFIIIMAGVGALIMLNYIMTTEMSTASSRLARYDHLQSGIKTFLQHPIFGVGYNNTEAIAKNHLYRSTPIGASMGIATFLGEGGLYMFLLYVGSAVSAGLYFLKYNRERNKDYVLFLGALFISWFISNIGYSTMMIFMVSTGYALLLIKPHKYRRKMNSIQK